MASRFDMQMNRSHYDQPTVVRQAAVARFTEKYDHPTNFRLSQQQQQQQQQQYHQHRHQRLRAAKSLGSLDQTNGSSRNGQSVVGQSNLLADNEVSQIELFLRAHKSFIYVGRCLVNLYFTRTDLVNGGRNSRPRIHEWELSRTGVPVIIFDKGETKSRDKRQLQICVAERGSGFVLWRDVIDNLSDYSAHHPCFHTLYLSSDHRKMAGLSFDSQVAAEEFLDQIETLTSDPLNIALTGPKKPKKLKFLKKQLSASTSNNLVNGFSKPKKCDISSPCLFQHVTSVELCDYERLFSLATLVPSSAQRQLTVANGQSPSSSVNDHHPNDNHPATPTSASPSTISSESNVSV